MRRKGPTSAANGSSDPTRGKLLEAAGPVFAEHGYYGSTVREICKLAGVNVAAVNYHFGDKLGLYTEVLQESVRAARIDMVQAALDQNKPPEEVLRAVIHARLQGICRGDLPDWHFRIMAHELVQPTPALARVVQSVTRPIYKRLLGLVGRIIELPPEDETTRLCAHSVMGQILFYVLQRPMLVRLWPELKMTPDQMEQIADHIADFSLAYLNSVRKSQKTSGAVRGLK